MMPNDVKNELEPLLARCASGEAAALKLLYKNTAAQLFGVLRRILLRDDGPPFCTIPSPVPTLCSRKSLNG